MRAHEVSDYQNMMFVVTGLPALVIDIHAEPWGNTTTFATFNCNTGKWRKTKPLQLFNSHGPSYELRLATATEGEDRSDVRAARDSLIWMDTAVIDVPCKEAVGGSYEREPRLGDYLTSPELDCVQVAQPGETARWICVRVMKNKSHVQVAPCGLHYVRNLQ